MFVKKSYFLSDSNRKPLFVHARQVYILHGKVRCIISIFTYTDVLDITARGGRGWGKKKPTTNNM